MLNLDISHHVKTITPCPISILDGSTRDPICYCFLRHHGLSLQIRVCADVCVHEHNVVAGEGCSEEIGLLGSCCPKFNWVVTTGHSIPFFRTDDEEVLIHGAFAHQGAQIRVKIHIHVCT